MASYRLTNGSYVVSLNPEYDLKMDTRKVENSHRTRTGGMYRYVWGSYDRVKFSIENISSKDANKINTWWKNNTPLMLYDLSSTVVVSGYLTNASAPIDQMVQPYYNLFKGIIELEGY